MDITWRTVLLDRWVWADLLAFAILSTVHLIAWREVREERGDPQDRERAAGALRATATAGISAVGILIPFSLVAVRVGSPPVPASTLVDVFVAELWLAFSMAFGLFVIWLVAAKGTSRNVLTMRLAGLPYGWQLIALLVGVVRLLVGIGTLVEGLRA